MYATNIKKQEKLIPPKEHNYSLVINPKDKEILEMPQREFRMMILKKLKKVWENKNRKFNDVRKKYATKMKNQTEIEAIKKSKN